MNIIRITVLFLLISNALFAQLFPMQKDGKWGYIDQEGDWQIEAKYQWATNFHEELAAVALNDCWIFIDKEGNQAFDKSFCSGSSSSFDMDLPDMTYPKRAVKNFSNGLAAVSYNGKNAYVDKEGNIALIAKYTNAWSFADNGLARVEKYVRKDNANSSNKFGFINKQGEEVIKAEYDKARDFSDGLAAVYKRDKGWGFIDEQGNVVIPLQYYKTGDFNDGLAWYGSKSKRRKDGYYPLYGFLKKDGSASDLTYYEVKDFNEGLAPVQVQGKGWVFINKENKIEIEGPFKEAEPFSDGLALITKGEERYFINKNGKNVVEPAEGASKYYPFNNGLSKMVFSTGSIGSLTIGKGEYANHPYGYYGYMNKDGEVVAKQSKEEVAAIIKRNKEYQDKILANQQKFENRLDAKRKEHLENCPQTYIYGEPSANFIQYKIGGRQRVIYFNDVDIFDLGEGAFEILFPPLTLNSDDNGRYTTLSWNPNATFSSDKLYLQNTITPQGDCFFKGYRKQMV